MSVATAEAPVDLSDLWRRVRAPTLIAAIAVTLITLLALIGAAGNDRPLDPRNTAPDGAHALAALLADRGVAVNLPNTLADVGTDSSTTVLLADPEAVPTRALTAIAGTTATVVAVDPTQRELAALDVPATVDNEVGGTVLQPGCGVQLAQVAGAVRMAGDLYRVNAGSTGCYRFHGDAALVRAQRPNSALTYVIGSPSTLTNAELGTQGNAALSLGLLNTSSVQWVPGGLGAGPVPKSHRGLLNLLPSRLLWATLQLFIALTVFALWRARRLGRPVAEPLPVIVRAAETVEGQARLMQAAKARDGAAKALRAATIGRLSAALRIDADADPATVSALVADRTGMPTADISALLYGGDPQDDPALVRMAQALPRLEAAVQRGDAHLMEVSS
jgi:hypothetical protein